MHAIVVDRLGDAGVMQWREVPEPAPGPGQVAIRVVTTSVNFADVMRRRGGYRGGPPPFTPGLDCTGTIAAVGPDVRDLRVGQRVAAFPIDGGYAEVALARAVLTYPLPDSVSDEAAASLTVVVTAYNLLTLAGRLVAGEKVLVHSAAGGVGTTLLQMAKAMGAGTIVGVAGGTKLGLVREMGADVALDHDGGDLEHRIRDAAGGAGVDLVLDAVAGPVVAPSLAALAPFGRYVVYGMASGQAGEVQTTEVHGSNRALVGYSTGGYRDGRPEALRPAVEAAYRFVVDHGIRIVVGARYPAREAAEAHRFVESRASTGRVLLDL